MGDEKKDMEILLNIQNILGTVVEATSAIKNDIVELKQRDQRQSDELEKAYEKAKARQDSIRDDLQHQIDNDHQLITEIKNSIDSFTVTISGVIEQSKKNAEIMIKQYVEKSDKKYDETVKNLETRIITLENEKKNKVYSRWEKISDKIFWIIVAIIFAAVFKYLNFTPPKL